MRILTKEELIRLAPERWKATYYGPHSGWHSLWDGTQTGEIYKQLRDMVDPTEDKIEAVIGNRGWTRLECGVCHKDVDKIVMLEDRHAQTTLYVCQNCISIAHAELNS